MYYLKIMLCCFGPRLFKTKYVILKLLYVIYRIYGYATAIQPTTLHYPLKYIGQKATATNRAHKKIPYRKWVNNV